MAKRPEPKYVKSKKANKRPLLHHAITHADDTKPFSLRAGAALSAEEIIDKGNNNIKLLDKNFKCIDVMTLPTYPFDICASNKHLSEFYVTEPEGKSVHCIGVNKNRLKTVRSHVIYEDVRGITCWKAGVAVTVMRDGFRGTLGLLNYNFDIKKKVFESVLHRNLFKAPWHLESIKNGCQIVVSDQGNHSVTCLDCETLQIVFIVSSKSSVHLYGPRALTHDADDNIYVITSGMFGDLHQFAKISPDGTVISKVSEVENLTNRPSGIFYCAWVNALLFQADKTRETLDVYNL